MRAAPVLDSSVSLDLLVLFDALYRERHLTRAAERLGRTQPAMSRALARMREAFDDALFVRQARGIAPTPRAEALAPRVRDVLDRAQALVQPAVFEPATLVRTFVLNTGDLVEANLLPALQARLAVLAPHVDILIRSDVRAPLDEADDDERIDLRIMPRASVPLAARTQLLFEDDFRCVVRKGHPLVKSRMTLALYASLGHIQIAPRSRPGGPVDDALRARGLERRVVVRTPSFLAAPVLCSRSDLVLTAPSRVLEPLAGPLGLRLFPLPLSVPGFKIVQAWHPRLDGDPAHRWFRALVARVASGRSA